MRVRLMFKWFDLWVGAFIDRENRTIQRSELMTHRQRMPQLSSRKWSRIANHKHTHFRTSRFHGDVLRRMEWIYRWLGRSADNPRWIP